MFAIARRIGQVVVVVAVAALPVTVLGIVWALGVVGRWVGM